ncbi:MAG TPA: kelch repeat-containing protein, partial [Candidatus Angelobacter sp.]|nr:kelch repeat-containing protein [Candidatus Angelobacter sp.]
MVRRTALSLVCLVIFLASGARLSAQTWTQFGPLARFSHTGVFDSVTRQTIVFGGQNPSTSTNLNDLWLISTGTDKHIK